MITRLLIANRGEIARRIMRTCRALGIDTVAVYSTADANAAFVTEADLAVPIGGAAPADSYLRGDVILAAAQRTGADAIHPGYGFLSENADFARAVSEAGITWVGPPPSAIEAMGSKIAAKQRMQSADVPLLPSVELTDLNLDAESGAAADAVAGIGYPLLIKASAGGGGRGMRVVEGPDQLADAIDGARREAASAFGDATIYAEKFVSPSKHVEVQIFGDSHGSVVHFGERECSVQRRHQKVIEEAPSPSIDADTRTALHAAAVAAGKAIGYQNAGTVEFLLDPADNAFYFLEVNTRLQVEHPVTEEVFQRDLVALQLAVASGTPVPTQTEIGHPQGHSVEARIYAEDPTRNYLPSTGTVRAFSVPDGVRLDAAFDEAGVVGPDYDAMIAKVISVGPNRPAAVSRLAKALRGTVLVGIEHNIPLLVRALGDPGFANGGDTELLERNQPETLGRPLLEGEERAIALLAGAIALQARHRSAATHTPGASSGFRNVATVPQVAQFAVGVDEHRVEYRFQRGRLVSAAVDGAPLNVEVAGDPNEHSQRVRLVVDGIHRGYEVDVYGDSVAVRHSLGVVIARQIERFVEPGSEVPSGSLVATMPGTIRAVEVNEGDTVEEGQTVVVMEAMKMELAIAATTTGTVVSVNVGVGDTVDAGSPLVIIE